MRRTTTPFFIFALVFFVMASLFAQEKRPFTVEDLWNLKRVSAPAISPDGKWAAVAVTTYDVEANKGTSDIFLLRTDGSEQRQLTTHKASDTNPIWSPDGQTIAFLSKRNGSTQLFLISVSGGEARQITDIPTGVSAIKWFPDGERIAFVSRVFPDCEDFDCMKRKLDERKKSKVKAIITEEAAFRYWDHWIVDGRRAHIFVVEIKSRKVRDLLRGKGVMLNPRRFGVSDYDISPDGKEICFEADGGGDFGLIKNFDLFTISADDPDAKPRNITAENKTDDMNPVYSPAGKTILFLRETKKWAPETGRFVLYDRSSGTTRYLAREFDATPRQPIWSPDSKKIYFSATVQAVTNIYSVTLKNDRVRTLVANHSSTLSGLSRDGKTMVFLRESFTMPPTAFSVRVSSPNEVQLSHFNDALLREILWGQVKNMKFLGADGEPVQMWLILPPNFTPGTRYPLVHFIHGGPHGAVRDAFHFRWNAQLFGAPGYVVAAVNFHGSTSFGWKFADSISGNKGDKPFTDIMKATDTLITLPYVDPQRLGATGGSYGGYMVSWINGHTDRFKVLVCHAGVYNWNAMMASDVVKEREYSLNGLTWTNKEHLDYQSSDTYSANFKTPTLVIHGERDFRVPYTQGLQFYNALRLQKIPTRLIFFPDENHWVLKPQNSILWYREVHAWLGKYLQP